MISRKNFFHEDIRRPGFGRLFEKPFAEPIQITYGIAQAVDMVNSHAPNRISGCEPKNLVMSGREDMRILDSNSNKIRDCEEPAIIDGLIRIEPVRQPVLLFAQQLFEQT